MIEHSIDEDFLLSQTPVSLVCIGDTGEALLLRAILESMNAVVLTHVIGTPNDFLMVMNQSTTAPRYLLISAHGGDHGLVFGDYANFIDTSALKNGSLPAKALTGAVQLPGTIVISTACNSARPEFAKAFLSGGARAYIAPGWPDGDDVPLVIHMLFHRLLKAKNELVDAWRHTTEHLESASEFKLFLVPPP